MITELYKLRNEMILLGLPATLILNLTVTPNGYVNIVKPERSELYLTIVIDNQELEWIITEQRMANIHEFAKKSGAEME